MDYSKSKKIVTLPTGEVCFEEDIAKIEQRYAYRRQEPSRLLIPSELERETIHSENMKFKARVEATRPEPKIKRNCGSCMVDWSDCVNKNGGDTPERRWMAGIMGRASCVARFEIPENADNCPGWKETEKFDGPD